MRTQTKDTQAALTPHKALELLKDGNARFQANLKANRNLLEQVNITAEGQYPFAVVLSCIDSRTSAELIFDQGLGDILSIRIAGNVLNDDIVGSMEFACTVAGSKLIVVLGSVRRRGVGEADRTAPQDSARGGAHKEGRRAVRRRAHPAGRREERRTCGPGSSREQPSA